MTGSWLGRGRGGRLAIYAGSGLFLILIMLLYRAASIEMSRLRKLNELCTNQQEALASQLQVIYEYKVRLEKFLADEKSSNAAVKQELQQRASRENVEAMQKFNALQQQYKLLQSENQDLDEELKTLKSKTANDIKKYTDEIQQLKMYNKVVESGKNKSMEQLKNKYSVLENEKNVFQNKYNHLLKVVQLKRELDDTKKNTLNSTAVSTVTPKENKVNGDRKTETVAVHQLEQRVQLLPQPSPSNQFQSTATSPVKAVVSAVPETQIKLLTSTISSNVVNPPFSAVKSKLKIPAGVVPIPIIPNNRESEKNSNEAVKDKKNSVLNKVGINNDKNNSKSVNVKNVAIGEKHGGKETLEKQENAGWMQEIGDEDNLHERLPGFDDPVHPGDLGEENYDNEFYKDRLQKNNEEVEDEREDDVMMDYPVNNLKV